MTKKIPQATIKKIQGLAKKGYGRKEIAKTTRVSETTVYFYSVTYYKGFASIVAYHEYLARKKGYASRTAYQKQADEKRSQRAEYKELSRLVRDILDRCKRNRSWLAAYLGVSRQAASFYGEGKRMPSQEVYQKLRDLRNKTARDLSLEEKIAAED